MIRAVVAMRAAVEKVLGRFGARGNAADVMKLASGTAVSHAVLLVGLPILTRFYAPAEFGAFAVAHTIGLILVVFLTFRSEAILIYERFAYDALRFLKGLLAYAALVVAVLFVGVFLLDRLSGLEWLEMNVTYVYLSFLLAFLFGASLLLRGWLVRCRRTGTVSVAYGVRGPVFVFGAIAAAALGLTETIPGGVVLLTAQIAGEAGCFVVLSAGLTRREVAYLLGVREGRVLRALAMRRSAFSASFGSQVILQLSDRLPLLIVSAAFGPTAAGLFSLAERVVAVPFQLISTAVIDVFNRQAGEEWKRNGRFDHVMRGWLKKLLTFSTLPFLVAIALFFFFTGTIFGEDWEGAWFTLCVLSLWSFGYFNFRVFDRWFVPTGRYVFYFLAIGSRLGFILILALLAFARVIDYNTFVVLFVMISFAVDVSLVVVGLREARGRPVPQA